MSRADWISILPALALVVGALGTVALDLRRPGVSGRMWTFASLAFALVSVLLRLIEPSPSQEGFRGAIVLDSLALFLSLAILSATGLAVILSGEAMEARGMRQGEYYGLLLLAAAGMILLVQSLDLVTLFVSLEILSLGVYALSGILRRDRRSNEAAIKYFVTGAFAMGFLLYGMALLYGATGSLAIPDISRRAGSADVRLMAMGILLLAVGISFKVGAVPFHMWVPDVYEGAPTSVTAFMSVAVKAAGFGAFLRILTAMNAEVALEVDPVLAPVVTGVGLATMVAGNLLAIGQRSVKRMLAYSSVAHTGYVFVGVASLRGAPVEAGAAVVFYLLAYTFMTLGAFAMLSYAGRNGRDAEDLDDFAGLARRRPWAALLMTVFLVSLAGFPPTAGFFGKFLLFKAAAASGEYALVVTGVVTSAVALWYYLRVVAAMFMLPEPVPSEGRRGPAAAFVVGFSAAATLLLGLLPGVAIDGARRAMIDLLR